MAEIDKGLPNTRTEIDIPSEEELQEVSVQEETPEKGPTSQGLLDILKRAKKT